MPTTHDPQTSKYSEPTCMKSCQQIHYPITINVSELQCPYAQLPLSLSILCSYEYSFGPCPLELAHGMHHLPMISTAYGLPALHTYMDPVFLPKVCGMITSKHYSASLLLHTHNSTSVTDETVIPPQLPQLCLEYLV